MVAAYGKILPDWLLAAIPLVTAVSTVSGDVLAVLERLDRERVQTLAAYAYTLFDFARQHGVEGERLAQINRWEFTLEAALSGQKVGQPIFLRMARDLWPLRKVAL